VARGNCRCAQGTAVQDRAADGRAVARVEGVDHATGPVQAVGRCAHSGCGSSGCGTDLPSKGAILGRHTAAGMPQSLRVLEMGAVSVVARELLLSTVLLQRVGVL
jgi:hypothetical protein